MQTRLALQLAEQAGQAVAELPQPGADAARQGGLAVGQIGQVLEQETVGLQPLHQQLQEQPVVLDVQAGVAGWRLQQWRQLLAKTLEQRQHQGFLAAEVVVEIARADAQFGGDLQHRDIRLAPRVEALQRAFQDAIPGLHRLASRR